MIPPLAPLYLTEDAYRDARKARPDVDWDGFESRLEIQIRRTGDGKVLVVIYEDTPAAEAIREAIARS